jgi:hypothetical protein
LLSKREANREAGVRGQSVQAVRLRYERLFLLGLIDAKAGNGLAEAWLHRARPFFHDHGEGGTAVAAKPEELTAPR